MSTAAVFRAEAAAADALAARLESEARMLPGLLDGVAARTGVDVWRGPAADEFAAALRRWRSRLDAEAATLLSVARRLRARADGLRCEAVRVAAAEAEAQAREAARRAAAAERRMGAHA